MFYSKLSIKNKFLIVFIPILIIMVIAFIIFTNNLLKSNLQASTESNLFNQIEIFENLITQHSDNALLIAKMISQNSEVQNIYKIPNPDEAYQNIKKYTDNYIKSIVTDPLLFKIHFHKPPAFSFYRSWVKKHGDDLSGFRKTILEVYKTQKPLAGIELGVGGFALRGISPIFDDNKKYLGSLEFSYSPEDLLKVLTTSSSQIGFFNMVDAELADKLFVKEELNKSFPNKLGNYYVSAPSSEWIKPENLVDDKVLSSLDNKTKINIFSKEQFSIGILNIFDFSNTNVGLIVFVQDNSEQLDIIQSQINTIIIAVLILAVIFYLLFIWYLKVTVTKSLGLATSIAKLIEKGDFKSIK